MIQTYVSQRYLQFAAANLLNPTSLVRALALSVLLGFNPILTSAPLYAQETAHPVQFASVNINSADAQTLAEGNPNVTLWLAPPVDIRHPDLAWKARWGSHVAAFHMFPEQAVARIMRFMARVAGS